VGYFGNNDSDPKATNDRSENTVAERGITGDPGAFDSRVISYRMLRNAVGIIGIVLPLWLVLGGIYVFQVPEIQPSISDYYHTVMRDWLVGGLFAIGVFLFSYKGYDDPNPVYGLLPVRGIDDLASTVAGICAVGVAIFPTRSRPTIPIEFFGNLRFPSLHVLCAAGFFLSLAFISFFLFPKHHGSERDDPTGKEPLVYRACGVAIVVFLLLIVGVWKFSGNSSVGPVHPVVVLETLALWAFGVSWIIKGKGYDRRELRQLFEAVQPRASSQ
jgi:hypothetical protein